MLELHSDPTFAWFNILRMYVHVGPDRACVWLPIECKHIMEARCVRKTPCCSNSALCHRSGPAQMHKIGFFISLKLLLRWPVTTHASKHTHGAHEQPPTRPRCPPITKSTPTNCSRHRPQQKETETSFTQSRQTRNNPSPSSVYCFPHKTCRLKAYFHSATAFPYLEEWGWEQNKARGVK